MPLKLKPPSPRSPPSSPFSFDVDDGPLEPAVLSSPPTHWHPGNTMRIYGAQPLSTISQVGVVRCKDCSKPVLRSTMSEHLETCATLSNKSSKSIPESDGRSGKKRKASPAPEDSGPAKKKTKSIAKVTKGRVKGPVDYDRHCGVINDKGFPCSRSLTCKSHSMGAKRAVQGRTRPYDDLLLDWQRANNPNFVEPVKRETKAEKKEKRDKEKLEKKRLADEAAAALGLDPSGKKSAIPGTSKKPGKKAAAAAAVRLAEELGEEVAEDMEMLDSEAEMDELVRVVRVAEDKGVVASARALHFYLDANQKRCFIEELPTDTVVEGTYRALEWSDGAQAYSTNPELGIIVEVVESDKDDNLVRSIGPPEGKFTFTSHDAGDHSICLSTNYTSWFSHTHIRLYLDIVVGTTKPDVEQDRTHVSGLAAKVRDLNIKLEDIRREQQYQREREADYRDLSEATNARAVWYSIAQIIVLVATCAWQLRHLKRFFEDRKSR
ncbi:hypothetical protein C0992_003438 [Termitomyces sp. T32_za158]|nr:hypothetical protein C0992_003438 [Termitomyces sp. T32_za158]